MDLWSTLQVRIRATCGMCTVPTRTEQYIFLDPFIIYSFLSFPPFFPSYLIFSSFISLFPPFLSFSPSDDQINLLTKTCFHLIQVSDSVLWNAKTRPIHHKACIWSFS